MVIVPLGSWEQHGAHLPSSTDSDIIAEVVRLAADGRDVVVAPVVSITASDEHRGFPGTLSTGTEALAASLVGIARSAAWACGVLFANGHGGNADALVAASAAMSREGLQHAVWSMPAYEGADAHAGRTETSVMLHLRPGLVRLDLAEPGNTADAAALLPAMREGGVRAVSGNGVLGDPTTATAEHGRAVVAMWVTSLAQRIDSLSAEWATHA